MDLRCLLSWIKRQSISYSQVLQSYQSLADSIFGTYCESVHLLTPSHGLTRNVCSACPLGFADTAEMTQISGFFSPKPVWKANPCPNSCVVHKERQRLSLEHEQETQSSRNLFLTEF